MPIRNCSSLRLSGSGGKIFETVPLSSGGKNLRDPPLSSGLLSTFIVVSEPVVVKALAESFAGNQLDSGQKKQRNFRHVYRRSCADVDLKNGKSGFDNLTRTRRIDRFRRTSPIKIALLLFEEIVGIRKDTVTPDPFKRKHRFGRDLAESSPSFIEAGCPRRFVEERMRGRCRCSDGCRFARCCIVANSRSGFARRPLLITASEFDHHWKVPVVRTSSTIVQE